MVQEGLDRVEELMSWVGIECLGEYKMYWEERECLEI